MRVGILSDTHDRLERTAGAVALLAAEGAEVLFHCGDLTTPEIVHECAGLPCHYVLGNNDFDLEILQRTINSTGGTFHGWGDLVELDERRIAFTHGHLAREFRRLLRTQPDYLLFGHTHVAMNERDGKTRQINPGALTRARTWTVALLDLETDHVNFLSIS